MEQKKTAASTLDEVSDAIDKLTTADWVRLDKAANSFLFGATFSDAKELINETFIRILEGDRKWPPDVPFVTFCCNAMKSVADCDRNLVYKREEILATDLSKDDPDSDSDPLMKFGDKSLSPETIIISESNRSVAENDLKIIDS